MFGKLHEHHASSCTTTSRRARSVVQDDPGQLAEVRGELVLVDLGLRAEVVEAVDVAVGPRVASPDGAEVDALDQAADVGRAGVGGVEVDGTGFCLAGEAAAAGDLDDQPGR